MFNPPTFRPFLLFTLLALVFTLGQGPLTPLTVSAQEGTPTKETVSKMPDQECDGLELCISELSKPAIGEEVGKQLVLRGTFPADVLEVTLRDDEGTIVYGVDVEHNGSPRLKIKLNNFSWQPGSYTITVISQGGSIGESWDLDVTQVDSKLVRAGGSPLDLEKLKEPAIGQMMSCALHVNGTFDEEIDEATVTLTLPNGKIIPARVISQRPNDIWVDVGEISWEDGTYHLTVISVSGHTDTLHFGVGHLLQRDSRAPMGCSRGW